MWHLFINNKYLAWYDPRITGAYTASTTFGSGSQIGTSGWYCVYDGSGTGVTVTGLSAGTTYQVHVCEYNGEAGFELYLTSSGTDNPDNETTLVGVTFTNGAYASLDFQQVNASPPESDWLCGQFSLIGDAIGATLNSVTVTLGGTYDPGDLQATPFQLYASNTNSFSSASTVGSSVADPGSGNDVTFSSRGNAIPSSTRYYWVTADISVSATGDDNMIGTIDAPGDLSILHQLSSKCGYAGKNISFQFFWSTCTNNI